MWDEVMICNWEDGHIQATGRDAKGRKQYIYHSKYEEARQQEKFDRMYAFGKQLIQNPQGEFEVCQAIKLVNGENSFLGGDGFR